MGLVTPVGGHLETLERAIRESTNPEADHRGVSVLVDVADIRAVLEENERLRAEQESRRISKEEF